MTTLNDVVIKNTDNYLNKLGFLGNLSVVKDSEECYYFGEDIIQGNEDMEGELSLRKIRIWNRVDCGSITMCTVMTLSLITGHLEVCLCQGGYRGILYSLRADIEEVFQNFPCVEESELELIEMLYPGLNTHMIRQIAEAERKFRTSANHEGTI